MFFFERERERLHQHAYMEIWTPVMGEILVVKIKPTNRPDIHAVAIYRDVEIVGYVPYNLAPRMSAFFVLAENHSI